MKWPSLMRNRTLKPSSIWTFNIDDEFKAWQWHLLAQKNLDLETGVNYGIINLIKNATWSN